MGIHKTSKFNSGWGFDVKRLGVERHFMRDFYHEIMKMSWLKFFSIFIFAYLLVNCFFALLYFLGGNVIINADTGSYWEAFLFSFQTSTTIGYGHYLPKNDYAHIVAIFDSISGILFVAIATGIAFAKFSKPTARVLFSKNILIGNFNGKKCLMFRMGNGRNSQIIDAHVKVVITVSEKTKEGNEFTHLYDLELLRKDTPLFSLSWTVFHLIDEKSPLFRLKEDDFLNGGKNFIVTLVGIDDVFSQTVYDRCIYDGDKMLWNKGFKDIMGVDKSGKSYINYSLFHEVE